MEFSEYKMNNSWQKRQEIYAQMMSKDKVVMIDSQINLLEEFGTNQKTRFIVACEKKEEKKRYTYTVSLNEGDEVEVVAESCNICNGYLDMYMEGRIVACFKNWDFLIEEPIDCDEDEDEEEDTCCGFCDC